MLRLLLADDEESALNDLAKQWRWEDWGFRVCGTATNGVQALGLVDALRPDLLITDIRMNDLDGITLLQRVREKYPETRVALVSAYSNFEYAQKAVLFSADAYLTKPVTYEQISEMLEKVRRELKAGDVQPLTGTVDRAKAYIDQHYSEKLTLEQVSSACFVHPSHLSRLFHQKLDTTFTDYLTRVRMEHAAWLLLQGELRVTDIAAQIGYDDYSYFCRVFRKAMGTTPLEYQLNVRGTVD